MKVLVIYDGSVDSKAALKYGMQKAQTAGGQLIAFHVPRNSFIDDECPSSVDQPLQDSLRRIRTVKKFTSPRGDVVTIGMAVADVAHWREILKFADTLAVDLIVATPEFEPLIEKARCLLDIVSARSFTGSYN